MLRSRRATPIQDIVDGTATEDRADRRQKDRLCISTPKHFDSKGRRERNREFRAIVCRGASVQQESRMGGLLSLDALDDLGPLALELASVLDRGGLGGGSGGNLSSVVGLGCRRGRCDRRGSRNGLRRRSRRRLRRGRHRPGRRCGSRGLGSRCGSGLSHQSSRSAAIPRHATLMCRRRSRGRGCSRNSRSGTRDECRLLRRRRCSRNSSRRGGLSSRDARRNGSVGDPGLQACHALGQGLNRQIGLGTRQAGAGDLEHQTHVARAPHL